MAVYTLNPLLDSRWEDFAETHPRASIFHTPGWLEALRRTYGYEPIVYTTSAPGTPLANGIVFCRVRSWLTGDRMVSLPFTDHCEPLVEGPEERIVLGLHDLLRVKALRQDSCQRAFADANRTFYCDVTGEFEKLGHGRRESEYMAS